MPTDGLLAGSMGKILINGGMVPMNGRWVLRDAKGKYIDNDRYRNDLFDRYDLKAHRKAETA